MKRLFNIALVVMVVLSGRLMGQHCPLGLDKGGHGNSHFQTMRESLDLSDAQVQQFEALHEKYGAQIHALWADESLDNSAKISKMKEIRDAKHAEFKALLTPEQVAKVEAYHAENGMEGMGGHGFSGHHGHHGHHGSGGHHGHHGDHGHHGKHHQIHAELKQQLETILRTQRAKFETQLSAADKAAISELRTQFAALRPQLKAMRGLHHQGAEPTEAQKAQMMQLREQKHEVFAQALAIGERYQPQLQALHDEAWPQVEAIVKELKAQYPELQGHCEKAKADGKYRHLKGCDKPPHGMGHHGEQGHHGETCQGQSSREQMGHHSEMHHDKMLAHFILMDPDAPLYLEEEAKPAAPKGSAATKAGAATEAESNSMTVYPNPSSTSNTLRYSLGMSGQVRIELMTVEGKVVKVLVDGAQASGNHRLEVNTQDLVPGNYMYRLIDAAGSRTVRFAVVK